MSHFNTQPSNEIKSDDEDSEIVAASLKGGYLHPNESVRKITVSRTIQVSHYLDVVISSKDKVKKRDCKKKKHKNKATPASKYKANRLEELISKMPASLGGPYNDQNLEYPGTVDYLIRELQINRFIDAAAPLSLNQLERNMERVQWIIDNQSS